MAAWDNGRPDGATTHEVKWDEHYDGMFYASIAACVAAGLEGWTT